MIDDADKPKVSDANGAPFAVGPDSSAAVGLGVSLAATPSALEESALQDIAALKAEGVLSEQDEQRILSYASQIDVTNASTVVKYGAGAQKKLADFADDVLNYASETDADGANALILQIMEKIRDIDAGRQSGLFGLFRRNAVKPAAVKEKYRQAANDMDKLVAALKRSQISMLKSAAMLDRLQELNTECYHELSCFVLAGRLALASFRRKQVVGTGAAAATFLDGSAACNSATARFENKLHDLDVSRVICLQTAAQMQLVRDSQIAMIDKTQSVINHTIPLWKNQMALALGLADATEAARTQNAIAAMEAAALESQADELQELSKQLADEYSQGVVNTEAAERINASVLESLDAILAIQAENRQKHLEIKAAAHSLEGNA